MTQNTCDAAAEEYEKRFATASTDDDDDTAAPTGSSNNNSNETPRARTKRPAPDETPAAGEKQRSSAARRASVAPADDDGESVCKKARTAAPSSAAAAVAAADAVAPEVYTYPPPKPGGVYIQMADPRQFKGVIEVLKVLRDTYLCANASGISVTGIETGMSVMVGLQLDRKNFEECEGLDGEGAEFMWGVNVRLMSVVVQLIPNNMSIAIEYEAGTNHLSVIAVDPVTRERAERYYVTLLTLPDCEPMRPNPMHFKYLYQLPANNLQRICGNINKLAAERITFCCSPASIVICGASDHTGGQLTIRNQHRDANPPDDLSDSGEAESAAADAPDTFAVPVGAKMLTKLLKGCTPDGIVELRLAPGMPLVVRYNLGTMGSFRFCIAPYNIIGDNFQLATTQYTS